VIIKGGLFLQFAMKKQSKGNFEKFSNRKSNAAKKEQFKKEKREWKKEVTESRKYSATPTVRPGQARVPDASNVSPRTVSYRESRIPNPASQSLMPLNKFISHAGICARREAAELVKGGKVKVNGELVLEPGYRVSAKDDIRVNGKRVLPAKNLVYILLNKPKDYITTTEDPQKRKTVLDLIRKATTERVYPVGRLDRNTSGVLLLTNDGELAQKLTHPSNEVKKLYSVTLNKPLDKKDFEKILDGVVLEDGPAKVDAIAYSNPKDRTEIGVEIHSGRNRIVRRIFEHLGYDVRGLDRVIFAGLTKKNVDRGKWRYLSEKEVRDLKYFNKGK
jgi:23S rRNA pseudouridine2605 synthase